MDKHKKHAKIPRRTLGMYASSEVALIGATCGDIQSLGKKLIEALSDELSIGYLDADHKSFDNPTKGEYRENGANLYVSDKVESIAVNASNGTNPFDRHILFNNCDLVLTNGNHFEAQFQILFLDSTKTKSVEKRIGRLTNVLAIVEVDTTEISIEVQEAIPNATNLPRFKYLDTDSIISLVRQWMSSRKPTLNALILAGGKSTRMGQSKANMLYQNTAQLDRISSLVESKVDAVYVSCRKEQEIETQYPKLYDRVENMGPLGAITNAFRSYPDQAWLVVACDLPLLDSETLDQLISSRSIKHMATGFLNKETGFAEPLIAIWEPKSYMRMLQFEALGYTCPRKVLINSNTHLIEPINSEKLMNVNTPEEFELAKKLLS